MTTDQPRAAEAAVPEPEHTPSPRPPRPREAAENADTVDRPIPGAGARPVGPRAASGNIPALPIAGAGTPPAGPSRGDTPSRPTTSRPTTGDATRPKGSLLGLSTVSEWDRARRGLADSALNAAPEKATPAQAAPAAAPAKAAPAQTAPAAATAEPAAQAVALAEAPPKTKPVKKKVIPSTRPPGAPPDPWTAFASQSERAPGRFQRGVRAFGRALIHEYSLVILGGLLLAVVLTWPTLRYPLHTLPQDVYDPARQAWQLAWAGQILLDDPVRLWQANAFYPERYSLAYGSSLLGYAPAGMLGDSFHVAILRYNILFVLAHALLFIGGYALIRQLGAGRTGAVVAGVAFAYAPWRLAQEGHLDIISAGGIPLALAMLARGHGWSMRRGYLPARRRPGWAIAGWVVAIWQVSLGFSLGLPFAYVLAGVLIAIAIGVPIRRWRDARAARQSAIADKLSVAALLTESATTPTGQPDAAPAGPLPAEAGTSPTASPLAGPATSSPGTGTTTPAGSATTPQAGSAAAGASKAGDAAEPAKKLVVPADGSATVLSSPAPDTSAKKPALSATTKMPAPGTTAKLPAGETPSSSTPPGADVADAKSASASTRPTSGPDSPATAPAPAGATSPATASAQAATPAQATTPVAVARRAKQAILGWRLIVTDALGALILVGVGALIAAPYFRVTESGDSTAEIDFFSAPWHSLLVAPADSRLWGGAHEVPREALSWPAEMTLLPGFALYALALAGLFFSIWKVWQRLVLVAALALSVILTMGTTFFDGKWTYLPLFGHLPGSFGVRIPGRLMLWVTLILVILAAGAVADLVRRAEHLSAQRMPPWPSPWVRLATFVPLILVLAETVNATPHPVVPAQPAAMRSEAGPMLVLPTAPLGDQTVMLWSVPRFQPLANGGGGFAANQQAELRQSLATFPDPASIQYLRESGVTTVLLMRNQVEGTPWERSGDVPVENMGIRREDLDDNTVLFRLS